MVPGGEGAVLPAMPPVSRSANQTTLARPSASPLSTTSKTAKPSLIAAKDAKMKILLAQEHEEAIETSDSGDADAGEPLDDRSSSLSEPEDDHEDIVEDDAVAEDALNGDDDAAARQLLDYDSEATTERLDQTPQKLRKHADSVGRTPSKLNQTSTAMEELSEPPSPLAAGAGAASSTSTVATAGEYITRTQCTRNCVFSGSATDMMDTGQKRKRSETADSSLTSADSDLGESPRKKAHELPSHALDDVDDPLEHVEQSTESADRVEDTPAVEDARDTPTVPSKAAKGRKGRRGWNKKKEPLEEMEPQHTEDAIEAAEEPSEEKEAKTEEEIKAKKEASSTYEDVYKQFRFFREKLNTEQLAALTAELALLDPTNCIHPEYLKQVACVDARLQKQKSEVHAFFNYRMRSIRDLTLGERSQLHSQYYQSVREMRDDVLYNLGEDWFKIQAERRQGQNDDAHVYKFPTDPRLQKQIQAKYNQEVSILSGVSRYVGFAAAPTIEGVQGDTFDEDMKKMKISRRTQQPAVAPSRAPLYPAPVATNTEANERLAHQQYLSDHPWARPQTLNSHGTLGIIHTPDWAESGTKHLIRNLSSQLQRTSSPYATPLTQRKSLGEPNSSAGTLPLNSDSHDPPSSIVAAPTTTGRIESMLQASSNQTSPVTYPKHRILGQYGPELTGFRNISGISAISGASTIDVPSDSEHQADRQSEATKASMPGLTHVSSASRTVFDTSQLHRHPRDEREVYPNAGFRPQEGAFGTPAPLPPPRNTGT